MALKWFKNKRRKERYNSSDEGSRRRYREKVKFMSASMFATKPSKIKVI